VSHRRESAAELVMRTRPLISVALLVLAGLAAPASAAFNYMNQISGANGTGMYPSNFASATACMDDFEINGTTGNGPQGIMVPILGIEAVFRGAVPSAVRVNIYHNNFPDLNNLRTQQVGDAFSRDIDLIMGGQVFIQPYPVPGDNGNFVDAFLLSISFNDLNLEFGSYYLSIQALGLPPTAPFFILGSDNVTDGTPNDLVQVLNQGAGGLANVIPDNAAYRVIGVPTPGTVALIGLAGLAAMRRRRR
jgi:MYXO-CTERM domain-containing protein